MFLQNINFLNFFMVFLSHKLVKVILFLIINVLISLSCNIYDLLNSNYNNNNTMHTHQGDLIKFINININITIIIEIRNN